MMSKAEIRQQVRALKKELSEEKRLQLSRVICEKAFAELSKLDRPTIISLYLSMPDEVQTHHLIDLLHRQDKHTLVIPRVEDEQTIRFYELENPDNYESSDFGILEPKGELIEVIPEVMIVPGVAFDRHGGRIGRGRGYYDRYFARHSERIRLKIAIAYELQVFDQVPMDEYDHPMDLLITELS